MEVLHSSSRSLLEGVLKGTPPCSSFHRWRNFTPPLLTPLSRHPERCRQMGNGGCGQSVTAPLHCLLLTAFYPCSSVGPSHGPQSFRMKLLVHRLLHSCRGISAGVRGAPPPPLQLSPGCWQGCFSRFLLTPHSRSAFGPILTTFSQRCHRLLGGALLGPVVRL